TVARRQFAEMLMPVAGWTPENWQPSGPQGEAKKAEKEAARTDAARKPGRGNSACTPPGCGPRS
ncbi:hypothetical protein, partial [Streptomyces sp. NPDC002690]